MNSIPESGITVKKKENFSEWYQQVITKGKFIEFYDVSGCYILLPNSYSIWENTSKFLDIEFKKRDVKNVYFPLFVTKKNLEKEASHIQGFKAEVAWVTRSGTSELIEPIAIRPTSESIIYSKLTNIIQSYQDLPVKFNQWCNVVRWEFKDPTPFIRSREFLWNEGHSCFASQLEAETEVLDIINLYKTTYQDMLAVPTIIGRKTEKEKFAGADSTYTVETYISESCKAVQAATAHSLGQNFSKMFDIYYQDKDKEKKYVWQTSWGFTTRSLGIMLMTHGDDVGAIIPPNVADIQIAIIPIIFKGSPDAVYNYVEKIVGVLKKENFRVHVDKRDHSPGWKFNYWERLGVPLRIEVGPKDLQKNVVTVCRRHDQTKKVVSYEEDDKLRESIKIELDTIQRELYDRAVHKLQDSLTRPENWSDFVKNIECKMCLILWCGLTECEDDIKNETGAKSLCVPLEEKYQIPINEYSTCLKCNKRAKTTCLFGRSY